MKLEVVRLSDIEMRLAKVVARGRMQTKANEMRVGDPRKAERDEFIGSAGEIAFAKWMGIYPNISIALQPGSPDYVIAGVTIDVKATEEKNGKLHDLVVPMSKKLGQSKLYVLVTTRTETLSIYRMIGFTTEHVVFNPVNIGNRVWGDSHWVRRADLMNMAELRPWIKFADLARSDMAMMDRRS